ncbi:DUF1697 domain-containing protein [Nocardioides sp. 1609]|uniref:DUF1697 domain-containing protein n=1 Tax=Nocardioides sp. 1609 TaxID=2508327 RepID=UPI00106F0E62|nr:DUF1697 domain-containing protein [Nocardioides sp. 1609]
MTTHVAFLRAINLGATRKFPKEAIVAATGTAGFDDVATHINTGNVRFSTRMRSRARIEDALERAYLADRGFEVPTVVYRTDELRDVVTDADGFGHDAKHYVWLLKEAPTAALRERLEALSTADERVGLSERAVHLMLAGGYLDARLLRPIEKSIGVATNRNVTVLRALVRKWC